MKTLGVPSLNLMPAARVAHSRRSHRLKSWGVGLIVYTCAGVGCWMFFATSSERLASVHADVSGVVSRIETARAELKSAQARLAVAKREAEAREEVHNHPDFSILLRRIADAAGPEVTLDRFELKPVSKPAEKSPKTDLAAPWGYTLALTGLAGAQGEVPRFALELERLGLFESVAVQSIKAREAPVIEREDGTRVQSPQLFSFELVATLSDRGAARTEGAK